MCILLPITTIPRSLTHWSPRVVKTLIKLPKNDRSHIERTNGIVIEFGRRSFLVPLLPILLGPRLARSLAPCCCYCYHSAMPVIMPRELRDSPNLGAKSMTDPPFHWQEAVVGRRVPQPRLDTAQKQDGSPNEEED